MHRRRTAVFRSNFQADAGVIPSKRYGRDRRLLSELVKARSSCLCRRYVRHLGKYRFHVIWIDAGDALGRPIGFNVDVVRPLEFTLRFDDRTFVGLMPPVRLVIRYLWNSRHVFLL